MLPVDTVDRPGCRRHLRICSPLLPGAGLNVDLHRARVFLRKGITTLRNEGPFVLALRVTRLVCRPFGTLFISAFCSKDLTAPVVVPEARVRVDITRLADADVAHLALIVANRTTLGRANATDIELAERHVRRTLELGGVCFIASHEGEIVHHNWVFPGVQWQAGRYIRFEPVTSTDALCDDAFTLEKWRGNGIHGAVHASMIQFLQRSGCTTSFTFVSTDNRSSRKALTLLGYTCGSHVIFFEGRRSGKTRMVRIGGPLTRFRVGEPAPPPR